MLLAFLIAHSPAKTVLICFETGSHFSYLEGCQKYHLVNWTCSYVHTTFPVYI